MKKTSLLCAMLFVGISTATFAEGLYFAPTLFLQRVTAKHSTYNGLNPHVAAGYSTGDGTYYYAGEVFMMPLTFTLSSNQNNGAMSAKISRTYGISFIPGVMINQQWLCYLRASVVSSKFASPNATRTGGQGGLGFQTALNESWDMRVEYDYTAYKSIRGLGSVKTNEIGLGVLYRMI